MSASSQNQPRAECDVLVVGAGPAGSAAAITLARAGRSVVIIEKSPYDETRIGEALPPAARPSLERLGVWEPFLTAGHLPSPAVRSVWGTHEPSENHFIFNPYGHGWHLDRLRFDAMLARAAQRAGVRLLLGARIGSCSPLGAAGWRVQLTSGFTSRLSGHPLRAAYVIDATGRNAAFARRQGARRINTDRLVGLTGFLVPRKGESCVDLEPPSDACTLVEACSDGWWYSALLPRARWIATYMTDADLLPGQRQAWGAFWQARLEQAPCTRARLEASLLEGAPRVFAANSSRLDRVSGHRWLAAGDAAIAFDPLSSRGLIHALQSGIRAGEAINDGLSGAVEAMRDYDEKASDVLREYSSVRTIHYRREQRWPQSAFWRRRHAVAA